MLLELRVENYAVIDNVVVEFAPGLNLLTGETGAGKSILIDALALLLGEKASAEVVRQGAAKAVVAGAFEIQEKKTASILETNGLDSNGNELILRREIAAGGKGRVFVNNQPATVGVLRQLAPLLGVIHSQSESLFAFAFDAGARLALLDLFAGVNTQTLGVAYANWQEVRRRIADLERDEQDRLRLLDLWRFQKKEIEDAHLKPGEDQELEAEKRVLVNSERIYAAAMSAYDQLYDGGSSAMASLRMAARHIEELARFDDKFRDMLAAVDAARITVEDTGTTLRDYAEAINASPERLAEVEDRLALIDRLKRKYGPAVNEIIAYGGDVARKLNEIENRDEILKGLRQQLAGSAAEYLKLARDISRQRLDAAGRLEKLVETEVNDLAMKARFKIDVSGSDEEENWTPSGFDRASYLIAANPGEPLGPVEQIASGGELSRVMLALNVVVAQCGAARQAFPGPKSEARRTGAESSAPPTLVFDEIDTGIGGRAAEAVGRKLKALARANQVLCVTHLPQIASFADYHYQIEKQESGGRTRTLVRRLDNAERTKEVARMLSGAKVTDVALKNAAEMLKANA